MNCDSCQMVSINGVACHETGCCNAKKTWSEPEQAWIKYVPCDCCGFDVEVGTECGCYLPDEDLAPCSTGGL